MGFTMTFQLEGALHFWPHSHLHTPFWSGVSNQVVWGGLTNVCEVLGRGFIKDPTVGSLQKKEFENLGLGG